MKKINLISILAVAGFASAACLVAAEPAPDLTGRWLGTLDTGAVKLRVAFNISKAADGGLSATMDSLDQGAHGIPVSSVTVSDNSVHLEVPNVQGVYEGKLDATGTTLEGTWSQGQGSLPLTLKKSTGSDDSVVRQELSPEDRAASKAAAQKITGTWNGVLVAGPQNLHLRLHIAAAPDGTATGTMDSLDQGANGIPLGAITLKDDNKVRFEVPGVGGVYEGVLAEDGLTGQWQQGGQTLPLDFKKAPPE